MSKDKDKGKEEATAEDLKELEIKEQIDDIISAFRYPEFRFMFNCMNSNVGKPLNDFLESKGGSKNQKFIVGFSDELKNILKQNKITNQYKQCLEPFHIWQDDKAIAFEKYKLHDLLLEQKSLREHLHRNITKLQSFALELKDHYAPKEEVRKEQLNSK